MDTTTRMKAFALAAMAACAVIGGCVSPSGATAEDKRVQVLAVRDETIRELNRREPKTVSEIARSAGYAVFTNFGTQFIFLSSGNGYGVAVDNTTHDRTYMRTAGLGAGLGLGAREYRMVLVFRTRAALIRFVDEGWDWGASGSASARVGDSGESNAAATSWNDDVRVYQFTETGVMLGASLRGSRFWVDEELNDQ